MKKRWVYLVYVSSDDGSCADVFACFSSRKKCIEEVDYQHSQGNLDVDWYRGVLL